MYPYTASPDFRIVLLSYSLDKAPIRCIDLLNGEEMPLEFEQALWEDEVKKTAFNAPFEIASLNEHYEDQQSIWQWECTMVKCAMLGYPQKLETASKALKIEHGKDKAGTALIKFFTVPNKEGRFNDPRQYPDKWEAFKRYNIQDVFVEQNIAELLSYYKMSAKERRIWYLDQKINRVGVKIDMQLVDQALTLNSKNVDTLMEEARQISGLANPNSNKQLMAWLNEETPLDQEEIKSVTKDKVKELLGIGQDANVTRMLEIRQELSKSSIKKYRAMKDCVGEDGRARALYQFCGAGKTWRWAGRLFQIHNLTHTKLKPLDMARQLLVKGDQESLEMLYGDISMVLSNLIRTAIIPSKDKQFLISDFSAIEARVTAWFAQEEWRLEIFRTHGKIYEASAAQMFHINIDDVTPEQRSVGKVGELALGYQGSVGAMAKMDYKNEIDPDEYKGIVDLWRATSPKIVQLWYDIDRAAIQAVNNPGSRMVLRNLEFKVTHDTLFIKLPSGRILAYVQPRMKPGKFDKDVIWYKSLHQKTMQWTDVDTYGGKLLENIVQATSRDLLAEKMLELDENFESVVLHVHDEAGMEVGFDQMEDDLFICNSIMTSPVDWAPGLPLACKSFFSPYYIKD